MGCLYFGFRGRLARLEVRVHALEVRLGGLQDERACEVIEKRLRGRSGSVFDAIGSGETQQLGVAWQ